jgi:hypothetical protein
MDVRSLAAKIVRAVPENHPMQPELQDFLKRWGDSCAYTAPELHLQRMVELNTWLHMYMATTPVWHDELRMLIQDYSQRLRAKK